MHLESAVCDALYKAGVSAGDTVGVAVSGGADSTALLHLVAAVAPALGTDIRAVHIDHGLRPGSAAEAEAVERMATGLGIPCTVTRVEVRRPARGSLEAAARGARYDALEAAADAHGLRWIATGHTLDDQAETVLLRAMRGASPAGLAAIQPVRGRIVRPLLGIERAELRRWLRAAGIAWVEDPTNSDTAVERNWVRQELMPLMAGRRPGVNRVLARLAEHARMDASAIDALARDAVARLPRDAGAILLTDETLDVPEALAGRIVLLAAAEAGGRAETATVERVLALRGAGTGTSTPVGRGVSAWRLPDGIALAPETGVAAPENAAIEGLEVVLLPAWGLRVRVSSAPDTQPWRWRAVVPGRPALALRTRRRGDRVRTPGGTKSVADVLVDAKIPRPLRGLVPVLLADGQPVAVVGLTAPPVPSTGAPDICVVDVEPVRGGWMKDAWWNAATLRATS